MAEARGPVPGNSRRIRRFVATAAAALALSSIPSTAHADNPFAFGGDVVRAVGECTSPDLQAIVSCTRDELLTQHAPLLMLDINPIGTTIVVLGAGLYDDGSMRPMLVDRLHAALALATRYPFTPIVTSGGVPRAGVTESRAMRNWLVDNGVPAIRVTEEDRSRSTVENARNTAVILAARRASGIVIVSSPNHVDRAVADFRNAVRGRIPISAVMSTG